MPIFILYFLAAGAASIGGPAIGAALYKRGQQLAAAYEYETDLAALERLTKASVDLRQHVRAEAERAGLDPDAVERGYYNLRDRHPTLEQLIAEVDRWNSK